MVGVVPPVAVTWGAITAAMTLNVVAAVLSRRVFRGVNTLIYAVAAGVAALPWAAALVELIGLWSVADRSAFVAPLEPVLWLAGPWGLFPAVHIARCLERRKATQRDAGSMGGDG